MGESVLLACLCEVLQKDARRRLHDTCDRSISLPANISGYLLHTLTSVNLFLILHCKISQTVRVYGQTTFICFS